MELFTYSVIDISKIRLWKNLQLTEVDGNAFGYTESGCQLVYFI